MHSVLVLLFIVAYVQAISFSDVLNEEWDEFKMEHGKQYDNEIEESFRFKIFNENKHEIAKHNQLFFAGQKTYKLALNQYADLLPFEFNAIMNGYNHTLRKLMLSDDNDLIGATFIEPAHVTIPNQVDWRTNGAVTDVKDQGRCGSCWAFSTTGSLEGQHFRKTGVLVSLSEQNLIDCSTSYGNHGCQGGLMNNAFRYIQENKGIDTEKSYPYKGIEYACHFTTQTIGATVCGIVNIPSGNEQELLQAVATVGPISVAIDASNSFQFYSHGVYDEPKCSSVNLNHGVVIVGYGTESNGQDYWLVKNSWSAKWGDNGYIKMSRNKKNQCGIATAASYPLV